MLAPFVDASRCLDSPAQLRDLADNHGHVLIRGLLPIEAIVAVRRAASTALVELNLVATEASPRLRPGARLEGTGYDDPRWVALQERMATDEALRALAEHPNLVAVVETLARGEVTPHRGDLCRLGMPTTHGQTTPPHQDHHYLGGSADIWTAWTPLWPCPVELGPLAVWDASHRDGYRPHAGEGAGRQQVAVPEDAVWSSEALSVGDVVLFHCFTVHRALPNQRPDTLRVSVDVRYQPADQPIGTVRVDGTRA